MGDFDLFSKILVLLLNISAKLPPNVTHQVLISIHEQNNFLGTHFLAFEAFPDFETPNMIHDQSILRDQTFLSPLCPENVHKLVCTVPFTLNSPTK